MKYNNKQIIDMYKNGMTATAIAIQLKTYNTTIRRILLRNNIRLRSNSEIQARVKVNPFLLKTEKSKYWFGYFLADGNLCGNRVNISTNKDPEHLEKYAKYLRIKVRKYLNKKYNVWEYSVNFYSKKIKKYLNSINIYDRKSLDLNPNIKLDRHILRGIFDGDGSVREESITITSGSIKFIKSIKKFLKLNKIKSYIYVDKRGNYCYNLYISKLNFETFYTLIYQNSKIFMNRKYQAMGQLLSNKK
mgnify:CR=1 FL=1